jgi:hypothetical protein
VPVSGFGKDAFEDAANVLELPLQVKSAGVVGGTERSGDVGILRTTPLR